MSTVVTLLFPVPSAGAEAFDSDYYINKHLPLGLKAWSKYGLGKWSIIKLNPETGYVMQTIMVWESAEAQALAMKEAGAELLGDMKNFTTEKPLVVPGVSAAGDLI
ncbi:unnamed protein product [Periconia digitata]|uniref:Ethyl tert-butyl ether degradation EthD n=1 Tax=Periconia digitata TaxID=1303443 RepID=A0A9W4UIN0_9PLEO|nr:unnamed protein product [Periconia digitata]